MILLPLPIDPPMCACGQPAYRLILTALRLPEWGILPVPVCWDCLELLSACIPALDGSILSDYMHTTWLIYDFHPHTP
jgi:hypothetical protein